MAFPGGAGDLNSYMGGGDYETPSQSNTASNGQTVLLLLVASVLCGALLSLSFISDEYTNGDRSKTRSASYEENQEDSDYGWEESDSEEEETYNSLEDLSLDVLFESLGGTKSWVKVGDDDLILKVLENKTFENSVEDDFEVEVAKVRDLNNGRAEYLINVNMKEQVPGGQIYIVGITTYDIDGTETQHEAPNTNSKMFSIVANKRLKEVKIKTYTGKVVVVSGDIKIGDIVKQNIPDSYLLFDVSSSNGVKTVELVDSNNVVKAKYEYSGDTRHFQLSNKDGVTKVRVTDKNGFVVEKKI